MNFLDNIYRFNSIHNIYTIYLKRKPNIEELKNGMNQKEQSKKFIQLYVFQKNTEILIK